MNRQGAADLVAFGPSRHRAWVVSQRPLERSLGSRGNEASRGPLGGRFEASWGPFWGLLGPLLGLLGASWGPWGTSWGPPGASWGPLGASWGRIGAENLTFRFVFSLLGPSWGLLGAILGRLGLLWGKRELFGKAAINESLGKAWRNWGIYAQRGPREGDRIGADQQGDGRLQLDGPGGRESERRLRFSGARVWPGACSLAVFSARG